MTRGVWSRVPSPALYSSVIGPQGLRDRTAGHLPSGLGLVSGSGDLSGVGFNSVRYLWSRVKGLVSSLGLVTSLVLG